MIYVSSLQIQQDVKGGVSHVFEKEVQLRSFSIKGGDSAFCSPLRRFWAGWNHICFTQKLYISWSENAFFGCRTRSVGNREQPKRRSLQNGKIYRPRLSKWGSNAGLYGTNLSCPHRIHELEIKLLIHYLEIRLPRGS